MPEPQEVIYLLFYPDRVLIDPRAVDLPLTKHLCAALPPEVPVEDLVQGRRAVRAADGPAFAAAKRTLVVTLSNDAPLRTCRPSADYELPLGTGCPGLCQYCYLQSSQGLRPYIKVYADLDRILARVEERMAAHPEAIVSFEAASISDPMAVEHMTGALSWFIPRFAGWDRARLRLVTKFGFTGGLPELAHQGHTRIRYSLNTSYVIRQFEAGTNSISERVAAANSFGRAGYPIGFVLAPLFIYPGWEDDYDNLLRTLARELDAELHAGLHFELISHRFTAKNKRIIQSRFPRTRLDLEEGRREIKWGRYGRQKFVYPRDDLQRLWRFLREGIERFFPGAVIDYKT